ncbi:SGNH/GDSL hydrolase family protein [Bacteroides hominis]|uniref:SGNH/GDSL hydrolase family protein n=1 Tax=Bacteroides hominis TaxID=2763023 RepID=UPI003D6B1484
MKRNIILICLMFTASEMYAQWEWHNPQDNRTTPGSVIQNQGWNEDGGNYCRLPLRAKAKVRKKVWSLAGESAGLAIRFKTDAKEIKVKYKTTGSYSMPHMPATGVSGVDLYRNTDRGFCFGSYSFGDSVRYNYQIDRGNLSNSEQEYTLYLPLYNGVKAMEIGVPEGSKFSFIPRITEKPIVLYGTSIAQGACASRPGIAWGNIVNRSLEIPLINLGFSGNGKLEKEVLDFINEQEACAYIIDCMANLGDYDVEQIKKLVKQAVLQIREKHDTPILLVEHAGYSNGTTNQKQYETYSHTNKGQAEAYKELKKAGIKEIYYLSREELAYDPDAWVDYVHPSDAGMMRQAAAVEKKLRKMIK